MKPEIVFGSAVMFVTLAMTPQWPEPRLNHAMCYDAAQKSVLLFGGRNAGRNTQRDSTLWAWDGTRFTVRSTNGPSARSSPLMVCAPGSGDAFLHGGYAADVYNDSWVWNSSTWSNPGTGDIPARAHPAIAFDPATRNVILFGGFHANGNAPLAETWEWNGTSWRQLTVTPPTARYGNSMASDPAGQRIIMYGGSSGFGAGNRRLTDTWEWKNSQWRLLSSEGPPVLADQTLMIVRGKPVLVGSLENDSIVRVWEMQGATWREIATSNPPPARFSHAVTFDSERNVIVMFGGHAGGATRSQAELWELDATQWRRIAETGNQQ